MARCAPAVGVLASWVLAARAASARFYHIGLHAPSTWLVSSFCTFEETFFMGGRRISIKPSITWFRQYDIKLIDRQEIGTLCWWVGIYLGQTVSFKEARQNQPLASRQMPEKLLFYEVANEGKPMSFKWKLIDVCSTLQNLTHFAQKWVKRVGDEENQQ